MLTNAKFFMFSQKYLKSQKSQNNLLRTDDLIHQRRIQRQSKEKLF